MKRAPRLCACGLTVAHGEPCPCERKRAASRTDARPSASARGYDRTWSRLAREHLARHPRCVMCEDAGIFTAAEVVDHIIAVRDRTDLRLDPTNLQSLCRSHNARKATSEKRTRSRGRGGVEAFATTPKTTVLPLERNTSRFFSPAGDKSEDAEWPWF